MRTIDAGTGEVMNIERRAKARYPLELNVRYQTFGREESIAGEGRTVNLSSTGVLVTSSDKMSDGVRLRLTIEWPTLLNGTTPLQLVTFGRVVRSNDSSFAVALEHYQFRTMRRKPQAHEAAGSLAVAASATTLMREINSSRNRTGPRPLEPISLLAKSS